MRVPNEILQKGYTTFYFDTDPEIVKSVHAYNDRMKECRMGKRFCQEIEQCYLLINPLMVGLMIAFSSYSLFRHPVWAGIILPVYAIMFIIFFLNKDNMIVSTAFSLLLLFLDWRFSFFLILPNILLTVLHEKKIKVLKTEPGYPIFADICFTFEKMNTPRYDPEKIYVLPAEKEAL